MKCQTCGSADPKDRRVLDPEDGIAEEGDQACDDSFHRRTLAERIHRACPCADIEQGYGSCDIGCKCDPSPQHPQAPPTVCKWEGHAIAGEVEWLASVNKALLENQTENVAKVAALTAKISEGHAIGCRCVLGFSLNLPVVEVDPRCVEWRRK